MMHSESTTRSPSSFSFTRSTPCVEGCCGPMLSMISSAPSTVVVTSELPFVRASVIFYWALLPALDAQVFTHPGRVLFQNIVILAQRMPFPLIRQQNALQIRMAFENDAEHVVALAFKPIGRGPDLDHARHRLILCRMRFQAQPFVFREGVEIEDDVEAFFALWPVHRGQVHEHVEFFIVAAMTRDIAQLVRRDQHDGLLAIERGFANGLAETRLQPLYQ